ncbi:leucine-rich repeat-containing protein kinase family protein [Methylotenera sp.]|uniref:leucine-rich repeat-containing protein kinase family protein n=1 Tax=Methylotenera sp. TaxID=2051956 RepID=UPI002731CBEF|nr:leucine-rich repeat-containing protein kinase family protein [Methylotenera sp.]MDP2230584.1 leucine-rich repeat-containing protein kinase family protein [Methylotenera sp.]MDP3140496.1 leucine-rich repeat-containing protein kinase family protein [Methylotenera sp.]
MHTLSSLQAGQLAGVKRLDLSCGLTDFPREIFELAESLEILNLSGNDLSSLPDDLPRLHKLRVIFCSNNSFTEVPEVLGQCANLEMIGFKANKIRSVPAASLPNKLRWLILTDNHISKLPIELGACLHLQKLMLAGNKLQELPLEMAACRRLELLRISANRFSQLPEWLVSLPRLAWLAYAGNPCSDANEAAAMAKQAIRNIDWDSLELQHPLGEGASGVIYRANHRLTGIDSPVAVKLFKGTLTSDGLTRSEKAACIAAGTHSGLIPVIGEISRHPENIPGLVMSLIDPSFRNLAQPPSLESCTRDCYPVENRFSLTTTLNITLKIAEVAAHLHARGVMHGDLYAHNILCNEHGNCLLGDFGAASFIPQDDVRLSTDLQCIEVRAFACLLEELLDRCESTFKSQHVFDSMRTLQWRCAQPEVNERPLFDEIQSELKTIEELYTAQ